MHEITSESTLASDSFLVDSIRLKLDSGEFSIDDGNASDLVARYRSSCIKEAIVNYKIDNKQFLPIIFYHIFPWILLKREENLRISCKLCGQMYSLYEYPSFPWQRDRYGHEPDGNIANSKCPCHKVIDCS